MSKLLIFLVMGLFLIGITSAYICYYQQQDNNNVKEFKTKINNLAVKQDIEDGLTKEAIILKLKYFSPCR